MKQFLREMQFLFGVFGWPIAVGVSLLALFGAGKLDPAIRLTILQMTFSFIAIAVACNILERHYSPINRIIAITGSCGLLGVIAYFSAMSHLSFLPAAIAAAVTFLFHYPDADIELRNYIRLVPVGVVFALWLGFLIGFWAGQPSLLLLATALGLTAGLICGVATAEAAQPTDTISIVGSWIIILFAAFANLHSHAAWGWSGSLLCLGTLILFHFWSVSAYIDFNLLPLRPAPRVTALILLWSALAGSSVWALAHQANTLTVCVTVFALFIALSATARAVSKRNGWTDDIADPTWFIAALAAVIPPIFTHGWMALSVCYLGAVALWLVVYGITLARETSWGALFDDMIATPLTILSLFIFPSGLYDPVDYDD